MNAGDIVTLQRILDYELLEVTKRYLNQTIAMIQMQYDSFSPVDRLPINEFRRFGNKRSKR